MSSPHTQIRDLSDQFRYDLEAAYDMELELVDVLEELSRKASNDNLDRGFAKHRNETENQARRLEEVFGALGVEPARRDDPVVDGLIEENARFDDVVANDTLRDLQYLTAGMKTERYEMTVYEGLLLTAERAELGDDVTDPLEANLDEEERTFRKLEGLSTGSELKALWEKLTGD